MVNKITYDILQKELIIVILQVISTNYRPIATHEVEDIIICWKCEYVEVILKGGFKVFSTDFQSLFYLYKRSGGK